MNENEEEKLQHDALMYLYRTKFGEMPPLISGVSEYNEEYEDMVTSCILNNRKLTMEELEEKFIKDLPKGIYY